MAISTKIPAAKQLVKVVASGVGAVAGPMLKRWEARATADAMRIEAQAKADSIGIIAAAQAEARDVLSTPQTSTHAELDIRDEIRARLTFQEEKRQHNIEAVVRRAAEYLGDKDVENNEIDHDWTATFFTEVQDVSSEKMQQIWGKILAGEVDRPGSTSMRTLSKLKSVSRNDAELFQYTSQFVLDRFVLNHDKTTKDIPHFPPYSDFLRLSHHGLFQLSTGLQMNYANRSHYVFIEENDIAVRIYKKDNQPFKLEIPSHILSPSGEEIYRVIRQRKSDDYIHALASFLDKRCEARLAYARLASADGKPLLDTSFVEIDPSTLP